MIERIRMGLFAIGLTALVLFCVIMGKSSTPAEGSSLVPDLRTAKVIPDVIGDATDTVSLVVSYQGKAVRNAMDLTPEASADEPEIAIGGKDTYALLMVDPDAPSPSNPKYSPFLHWAVVNIPGVDLKRGENLIDYMGPSPPQGKHRYVVLLFKQSGRISEDPPAHRNNYDVKAFVANHGLGIPVNVVFFYSQPH